jgi:hypothetical protein
MFNHQLNRNFMFNIQINIILIFNHSSSSIECSTARSTAI